MENFAFGIAYINRSSGVIDNNYFTDKSYFEMSFTNREYIRLQDQYQIDLDDINMVP